MKSFMKKSALFAVIGIILALILKGYTNLAISVFNDETAMIISHKRELARSGAIRYIEGKDNVIFMGNSRVLVGIDCDLFDSVTSSDTYCYNLALPALPISASYFLLEDYVEHNTPPDFIMLAPCADYEFKDSLFNKYALQGMEFPEELLSYLVKQKKYVLAFNYIFPARLNRRNVAKYTYSLLLNRKEISATVSKNRKYIIEQDMRRGFLPLSGSLPDDFSLAEVPASLQSYMRHSPSDPFIDMFMELALKNKINVILIETPYPEFGCKLNPKAMLYESLSGEYPNVMMADDSTKMKVYPNRYFADQVHVNSAGAERYTAETAAEFDAAKKLF